MRCVKCQGLVMVDGYGDVRCWACGKDYTVPVREPTEQDRKEIRTWNSFQAVTSWGGVEE